MAAFFASKSLPSWLQAAAMVQSPARVVNPVPPSPGGEGSGGGAGILGGVGGGLNVVPGIRVFASGGAGVAGMVGVVGGVTFDVLGLVPLGMGPGLGVGGV